MRVAISLLNPEEAIAGDALARTMGRLDASPAAVLMAAPMSDHLGLRLPEPLRSYVAGARSPTWRFIAPGIWHIEVMRRTPRSGTVQFLKIAPVHQPKADDTTRAASASWRPRLRPGSKIGWGIFCNLLSGCHPTHVIVNLVIRAAAPAVWFRWHSSVPTAGMRRPFCRRPASALPASGGRGHNRYTGHAVGGSSACCPCF